MSSYKPCHRVEKTLCTGRTENLLERIFLSFANVPQARQEPEYLKTFSLNLNFREGETSARVRMLRAEKEQRFQERKVERAELPDYIRAQLELSGMAG